MENLVEIKEAVASLERRGEWNEAIEILRKNWATHPESFEACLLLIGECYWLLVDRDCYSHLPETERPVNWSGIRWDFEEAMLRAFEDGLERFHAAPWFLGAIGYLCEVNEIPFMNGTVALDKGFGRGLMTRARALALDDPLIARLGWNSNGAPPPLDLNAIHLRLENLRLRETLFDRDLLNYLKWSFHIHEQIEVDWEIPLG